MAVRIPLKLIINSASSNISFQRCTQTEVNQVTTEMIRQYGANPSATIAYGSGNMGTISNTRLDVGAAGSDPNNFNDSDETADVTTQTANYNKLIGAFHGLSAPSFSRGTEISNSTNTAFSFPCYIDDASGDAQSIRQFNLDDMLDTFWHPAAIRIVAGGTGADAAGSYITHTTNSLSNHTLVQNNQIFTDTRATASAYTAAGIPEGFNQQTVINGYYIHRRNSASAAAMPYLVGFAKNVSIPQLIPHATLSSQLQAIARYGAINEASYRIQYKLASSTSGYTTKSTVIDTKLDGSTYLTEYVGADDYRSQEVPSGSAITVTTYNFGIKIS